MAQRLYRISSLPLFLTVDQSAQLCDLLAAKARPKSTPAVPWIRRAKRQHPNSTLELVTVDVRVKADSIELPNQSRLMFTRGNTLKGFNPAIDRVFLTLRANGWSADVWFKLRPKKKNLLKKKQERIRVWSGGLPSLGKRR